MASRMRLAGGTAVLAVALIGCASQQAGRDRYRAIRGDNPPRPAAPLAIASPPAAPDPAVKPVSHIANPAAPAVQPAAFAQAAPAQDPSVSPLRHIYQKAAGRWASLDSYLVRLKRREVVAGKAHPEELILFKFRKEPFSVYFKWLGPQAQGREVVFVKGRHDDQINTFTASGDVPLMPAGMLFKSSPDSPLVRSRCRYPITEAGFGSTIQRFGVLVDLNERGDTSRGTLRYVGQVRRPDYERTLDQVVQVLAPRCDPLLPEGGERHWFFDPELNLPMLIVAVDHTGREVEYYCHDRFEANVGLDDGDFDPDRLWKKKS